MLKMTLHNCKYEKVFYKIPDNCMGYGSTIIAAENLCRNNIGIESFNTTFNNMVSRVKETFPDKISEKFLLETDTSLLMNIL
jgi:DNA modification methylase